MALYRDLTGKIRVVISRDELMDLLQNWREKSETKQLIAKLNRIRSATQIKVFGFLWHVPIKIRPW